jgi:hypothetical protein
VCAASPHRKSEALQVDPLAHREHGGRGPPLAAKDNINPNFPLAPLETERLPWDYWHADGSPKAETEQVLAALEQAMATNPDHPLALHLWIHNVEKQRPVDP